MQLVIRLKGKVLISGYDHELYNKYLATWRKEYRMSITDSRKSKCEVLWVKDNVNRQQVGTMRTAFIKSSNSEKRIRLAIKELKKQNRRITKSAVAHIANISREQLSRRYNYLFIEKCDVS